MQTFVVGDIHGCLSELKELIKDVDRETTRIILCGDLVDRGKDSEGVIDFVRSNNIECVQGNHETMSISCLPYLENEDMSWLLASSDWYNNGGSDVVKNYSSREKLIEDIKWLQTLPLYIETGIKNEDGLELLVSHAWTSQYNDIEEESKTFMFTWNRRQPKYPVDTPYFNVFGHTPVDSLKHTHYHSGEEKVPKPIIYEKAANLDTGCAYDHRGRGWLTGLHFPSMEIEQVQLKT